MASLSLTLASVQTPIERIFEKVMLRKMTEAEKTVLHVNGHVKPGKKQSRRRVGIFHKNGSELAKKIPAKLTSI
ncbi:MAG TPA: hypothetical protein VG272_04380 [Candidatus Acidoferrales bacterium]|jgi:hypothetical protein|nr:hypothetical protein [Candidatus Acidoferrales bacterium]